MIATAREQAVNHTQDDTPQTVGKLSGKADKHDVTPLAFQLIARTQKRLLATIRLKIGRDVTIEGANRLGTGQ
jgi:hypothetical protein